MAVGFLGKLQPELDVVDKKINESFKIRSGHLTKFAHVEYLPIEKNIRPSLVLLISRVFGNFGEQVNSLAGIIQFIYLAATVHFEISDIDQDLKANPELDPRDGSQIPVLVGDYLFGKFFTALCAAKLLRFLEPLAEIIAEINHGAMLRKQNYDVDINSKTYLQIVHKETASLFVGACRFSAILAKADDDQVKQVSDFGLNLGMAYGLLERKVGIEQAKPYLEKAYENLSHLPDNEYSAMLIELVNFIKEDTEIIPTRRLGEELGKDMNGISNHNIASSQKEQKVQGFFNSIAKKYDITNTILSFGRHNYWRKVTVEKTNLQPGGKALDVCCGTGMVTMDLARKSGPDGKVVGLDFSENMLKVAKKYIKDFPFRDNIELIQGNAMELPFPDNTFDCATIAYGLRNVPDMKKTLAELMRVIKPGGRVVSLEFAKPYVPVFKQIYNIFINSWLPVMGKLNAKNRDAYQYLHDSIMAYPHQDEVTKIYREMGYVNPQCYVLTWGIVAVHVGIKPNKV